MITALEKEYNRLFRKTGNIVHLSGYGECLSEYDDVCRLLEGLPFRSVCDVGCGGGALLSYILRHAETNVIPLGVDYNALAVRVIRTRVFAKYNKNFIRADFRKERLSYHADVVIVMLDIMGQSLFRHSYDCRYLVMRKMMNATYDSARDGLVLEPAMRTREDVEERLERNLSLLRNFRFGEFEFARCDPCRDYRPGDNWNIWALYRNSRWATDRFSEPPHIERLNRWRKPPFRRDAECDGFGKEVGNLADTHHVDVADPVL
jgi:SAM-dependent methyltransferase